MRIIAQSHRTITRNFLPHDPERLISRQGRIELVVFQRVVPEGPEKRPQTILRQLAVEVVFEIRQPLTAQHRTKPDRNHQPQRSGFQPTAQWLNRRREPPRRHSRATQNPLANRRTRQNSAENQRQIVRLANVANHLGGVDEIIDRDKIKSHAELIPESPLGHRAEQQEIEDNKPANIRQRLLPPTLKPTRRQHREQHNQGQTHKRRRPQVVNSSPEKCREQTQRPSHIVRCLDQ